MAKRVIEVEIIGDASKLGRSFDDADKSSGSFGAKMAKVGKIAAVGLAGGIGAAVVAGKKFVEAAQGVWHFLQGSRDRD